MKKIKCQESDFGRLSTWFREVCKLSLRVSSSLNISKLTWLAQLSKLCNLQYVSLFLITVHLFHYQLVLRKHH